MKEIRIFGPPGTGKTTTLSNLIIEACKYYGSDEVVVASFTKTAARELASKNLPLDDSQMGTLHALAFRHLAQPQLVEDKKFLEEWNRLHPYYAFPLPGKFPSLDNPHTEDIPNTLPAVFHTYTLNRAKKIARGTWNRQVTTFAEKWEDFKVMTHTVDFTDLIEHCLDPAMPSLDATVGFFDEVQDFSPLELALVRKWAQGMDRCYMAGDDDQCIYSFKGSIPDSFLNPPLPAEQKIILSRSYRLPRRIHQQATEWVMSISPREPKVYAPRNVEGVVASCPFSYKHPEFLLRSLEDDMRHYQTIMVLAACAYMLEPLIQVLRKQGIPFHNPYRLRERRWNPLRDPQDPLSAIDRLRAFLSPQKPEQGGQGRKWTYRDWWAWGEVLHTKVLTYGAKAEIERYAINAPHGIVKPELLEKWIDGDEHLVAMLEGDLGWLIRHSTKTAKKRLQFAVDVANRRGIQALYEGPKLIIGTIHSVKGGEAEVVWVFPDLSLSATREQWGSQTGQMAMKRLLYVAMTRAREKLVLCQPASSRNAWR